MQQQFYWIFNFGVQVHCKKNSFVLFWNVYKACYASIPVGTKSSARYC